MARNAFEDLGRSLHAAGVAPRHVRRLVLELQDHFEDLQEEALADGCTAAEAEVLALRRLGDQRALAQSVAARVELRCWSYRYPRVARVYYPFACLLLLPAAPVFAGLARASLLGRWCAALLLGATVTAAMLLGMQLSIALG